MSAVAKIAKPAMRGMHIASIKKNLVMATVVSHNLYHRIIHIVYCHIVTNIIYFSQVATVASTAWYLGVNKPRKEAYANFYATYDADKDFQRMLVRFSLLYPRYSIVSHNYYLIFTLPGLQRVPVTGNHCREGGRGRGRGRGGINIL